MNRIIKLMFIYLILSTAVSAQTYDLDTYLELVEKNSHDLKIVEKQLEMADAIAKEAWATALPKISATGKYNRNFLESKLFVDMTNPETGESMTQEFKISRNNEWNFNAVLNQTLFSFQIGNALTAARQYEQLSDFAYRSGYQKIMSAAKKLFYQTLLLKTVAEVADTSENNARANYENMKQKFNQGLISEFELLQAEVNWKNEIPKVTQSVRNYQLLLANLKMFAGIPSADEIQLQGDLETHPEMPDKEGLDSVLAVRPDYLALDWERKLRETGVRAEKSAYYPDLQGNLIFSYSSQSDAWKINDNENKNIIGNLTLNIPIYLGGYVGAQVQKAKVDLDKTEIQLNKMKEEIEKDLNNIHLRLKEAEQRIKSAQSTLTTTKKAFHIAQVSADNGLITQLELKDARLFNDQAQLNFYSAVYDYLDAYFDWELAIGRVTKTAW
ncbi:MAG: TolC family protein [Calditrichaceae bacterium]|nr:TolC family protein [Calditrichaceae bacterium]MBN2709281.1 TolC family protein [Calditrichaceae bacterium]